MLVGILSILVLCFPILLYSFNWIETVLYKNDSSNTYNPTSLFLLNQANTIAFFGMENASSSKGSVWKLILSSFSLSCFEFTGIANIRSIAYLNDDEMFYGSYEMYGLKRWVMQRIK